MRAWIDLGDAGWADVRYAIATARRLGYVAEEVRGARVHLRLSGSRLDVSDLWIMPP